MRYLSLFSGIEAASVAWRPLGWECVAVAEIEPFPNAVLAHRLPETPNLGDVMADDFIERVKALGSIDVLVGGSPCFVSGTLVLTDRGLVPIEQVQVGDSVLTHMQRWRRVIRTMSREAETICLKGQGHHGLVTTKEHPFLSKSTTRRWNVGCRKSGEKAWTREYGVSEWMEAERMESRYWASPTQVDTVAMPEVEIKGREKSVPPFSDEFFWFVGAWLGDGWLRTGPSGKAKKDIGCVLLCSNKKDAVFVASRLRAAGFVFNQSEERTTTRFHISSKPLCRWLERC